jgi:hypothetical protein
MVITKIQGGLGNQMFQYAFGRMLAKRNNTELKLDTTMFPTYKYHLYTMDNLHITAPVATEEEIAPFLQKRPRKGRRNFLYNALFADPKKYVEEPSFYFTPEMLELKEPCYVDGYWQSEKYFIEIEDIIRKEFSLHKPLNSYSLDIAEKIRASEHPVSLHVRRGDFAHVSQSIATHGTVSISYYEEALRVMKERVVQPAYFVFSDEPEWARENIKTDFPTEYIGQGPEVNYFDLELMKMCRHHILANSTFGWWGAWLSDSYRTGVTISPKRWNVKESLDTKDLLPEHWIKLSK